MLGSFESDFSSFDDELRQWSKEVKEEIRLASEKAANLERHLQLRERKEAKHHRFEGLLHRQNVETYIRETRDQNLQVERHKSIQRKQHLLDQLSDFDYARPWKRATRQCFRGTAQWLTKTNEFNEWIGDEASSLLWCTGKLGSGKTFVAVNTVTHLQLSSDQKRVAYFFCQFDNEASLTATTILSSLIKQLLDPETLSAAIESHLEELLRHGRPDVEDLELLLQEATDKSQSQFLVIDGIDECFETEKKQLLKIIKRTMASRDRRVKLLLPSRGGNDRRMKSMCDIVRLVSTSSPEANSDLETFVKNSIGHMVNNEELVVGDPKVLREIQDSLLRGADGMFLWVDFQLRDICSQSSDYEIRAILRNLPKDLPETYDRLLGRIVTSGKETKVKKVLRWIACAKRPLSLEELKEAICIEPYQPYSMPDRCVNDITQIPLWCHGLAVQDEEDGALQFAHHTVKSFLLGECRNPSHTDFHFELAEADNEAGEICTTYLNFNDFRTQLIRKPNPPSYVTPGAILQASIRSASYKTVSATVSKLAQIGRKSRQPKAAGLKIFPKLPEDNNHSTPRTLQATHPFLDYASKFWIMHSKNFSRENGRMWILWKTLLSADNELVRTPWTHEEFLRRDRILTRFIQRHEHLALLQFVEDSEYRLSSAEIDWLLNTSAENGSITIVSKALNLRQITARRLSNVLQTAAEGGHIEIVERLLAANAGVNARAVWVGGRTALQAAAERGHIEIVERLLAANADVNATAAWYGGKTALQAAADMGHIEIIERLRQRGAY